MTIEIREERFPDALAAYASVPIAFEVRERYAIHAPESGLGGLHLVREPVPAPYVKNYDAIPGEAPAAWPTRFDVARWGVRSAWVDGVRVGGVAVVLGAGEAELREERADVAWLWDLRVAPEWRGRGVGAALFRAAEAWARTCGATWLKVETQNVNVPACRFYARQGCVLGAIDRLAYPALRDEVRLLWHRHLSVPGDL